MLTLKLFFTVCLMRAVFSFRDLQIRRQNTLNRGNSFLVVKLLPWQRDESTMKEILSKVDDLSTRVDDKFNNLTTRVDDLSTMLKTTQTAITNILAGITIAVAVIGGAKTLFESIEYIPTIPAKIGKQNLEKENKELRNALREYRGGNRK